MSIIKTARCLLFLLALSTGGAVSLSLSGCSSEPQKHNPWNPAGEQRERADKTQRELSNRTGTY